MQTYLKEHMARHRLAWIRHYQKRSRNVSETCRHYGISRKTFYKWFNRYKEARGDLRSLMDRSRRPKNHPRTTRASTVKEIITLRKKTRYGPRRLQYWLEKKSITVGIFAIYRVLHRAGLIKKTKSRPKKYNRYTMPHPGDIVQVDIKYVPKKIGTLQLYQYSAIDDCTRWRFSLIMGERSNYHSIRFLKALLKAAPFPIRVIQTDNDAVFTNLFTSDLKRDPLKEPNLHAFTRLCHENTIRHKLIKPGCPRLNGKIERAHRIDEEEFYRTVKFNSLPELQKRLRRFIKFYNTRRPHTALDYQCPQHYLNNALKEKTVTYV